MDNKTILEVARRNGDRGNEYETIEGIKASLISMASMLVTAMILFAIDFFLKGVVNVSLLIVAVVAVGIDMLYRGITFKKIWRIVLGTALVLIALVMIVVRVVL